MGVFDKFKNMFFEDDEEIEEEEERPVKKQKKSSIAKKIDLPEMPKFDEEKSQREIEIEEEVVEKVEKKGLEEREHKNETFKFPMSFNDDDFKSDDIIKNEPIIDDEPIIEDATSDFDLYENPKYSFEVPKEDTAYKGAVPYEGRIETKKEPKIFRPTPVISPVYGILDKNYKKEDIKSKRDISKPSAYSKKVDLDTVREKAYGDLATDISDMLNENTDDSKDIDVEIEKTELYDLSQEESPTVNKVTVGDAEEYYNDLGLEYNVDYKDHSKEKATGRRSQKVDSPKKEEVKEKEEEILDDDVVQVDKTVLDTDEEEENNLFDLIDSMYADKEE